MQRITNNIIIHPGEKLESDRVVITPPETLVLTGKDKPINYTKSNVYYKDNMGRLGNLYIIGLPQWCFGVNQTVSMETGAVDGYQICYMCTSKDTVKEPTANEQILMDNLLTIRSALVEFASNPENIEEAPGSSKVFLATGDAGVKPIIHHPMMPDPTNPKKKIRNPDSAPRIYSKLMTKKDQATKQVTIRTKFHGPGDKEINPIDYSESAPDAPIDKDSGKPKARPGTITPVFKVDSIYYGAHGSSPYGASVQIKVSEANFTPYVAGGNSVPRMLPANTDTPAETEEEVGDEDDVFAEAEVEEETNPLDDLNDAKETEEAEAVEETRPTVEEEKSTEKKTKKRVVKKRTKKVEE
jgi:hypothetical protein